MAAGRPPRQQATSFWHGTRGVKKASLVSRHISSNFVSQHYEVIRRLGKGTFGHIDLVRDRVTGDERVCKVVSTAGMHPVVLGMMRKEVQVLSALDHPRIVKLYEFAEDEVRQELVLILEYVRGGDCLQLLRAEGGVLPEDLVARLVHQLVLSLSYCHARGIAHRDVKPENMMLTKASSERPDCKVIDFGLATPYKGAVREVAGTVPYLAPEVAINQGGYTPAADLWSVGVTAFELLAGVAPFGKPEDYNGDATPVLERLCRYTGLSDVAEAMAASPGWEAGGGRSSEALDFLRLLMHADPEARPTAAEAAEHPWLLRYRDVPKGLSAEILRGIAGYAAAPPLLRNCLFAVAAKGAGSEDETYAAAFLEADADGDGKVSRRDLEEYVASTSRWWAPKVDVEAVFHAADPDNTGFLGFTDFVAACLHAHHGELDAALAERAFDAVDHDRDGLARAEDIRQVFRDLPAELPRDRAFDIFEWRRCLLQSAVPRAPSPGATSSLPRLGLLGLLLGGCQLRQDSVGNEVELFEGGSCRRPAESSPICRPKPAPQKVTPPASPPRISPVASSRGTASPQLDLGLSPWMAQVRDPYATAMGAAAMAAAAMAMGPPDPLPSVPLGPFGVSFPAMMPMPPFAAAAVSCH